MKAILLFLAAMLIAVTSSVQTLGVWADSLETDGNIIATYPGDPVTAYIIGTMTNEEGQCAIGGAFLRACTSVSPDVSSICTPS
jgi:hypothetical protein